EGPTQAEFRAVLIAERTGQADSACRRWLTPLQLHFQPASLSARKADEAKNERAAVSASSSHRSLGFGRHLSRRHTRRQPRPAVAILVNAIPVHNCQRLRSRMNNGILPTSQGYRFSSARSAPGAFLKTGARRPR